MSDLVSQTTTTTCHGCGRDLKRGSFFHAITDQRSNGSCGGGMPNAKFDLCTDCAQIAFAAVSGLRRSGPDTGMMQRS